MALPRNQRRRRQTSDDDQENLRTEYQSLSQFFNTVVTFRFTVLGFFLAALALLLSTGLTPTKGIAILLIDTALWLVELRNRTLYDNLSARGMQIERENWGYSGARAYHPFFSHLYKSRPLEDPAAGPRPDLDYPRFFNGRVVIPIAVSHGCALDFLYLGVGLLTALYLLFTVARPFVHIWIFGLGA